LIAWVLIKLLDATDPIRATNKKKIRKRINKERTDAAATAARVESKPILATVLYCCTTNLGTKRVCHTLAQLEREIFSK
jgi:hypothetical protein